MFIVGAGARDPGLTAKGCIPQPPREMPGSSLPKKENSKPGFEAYVG
jgi:hypothetical protein